MQVRRDAKVRWGKGTGTGGFINVGSKGKWGDAADTITQAVQENRPRRSKSERTIPSEMGQR
jgi:hypothetical protein